MAGQINIQMSTLCKQGACDHSSFLRNGGPRLSHSNSQVVLGQPGTSITFHDHGRLRPNSAAAVLYPLLKSDFPEFASTISRNPLGNRIREGGRVCISARRVRKDVEIGKRQLFDQRPRRRVILIRLAGKPCDHVSAEPEGGDTLGDLKSPLAILRSTMPSPHKAEDRVCSALQWHVEMWSQPATRGRQ